MSPVKEYDTLVRESDTSSAEDETCRAISGKAFDYLQTLSIHGSEEIRKALTPALTKTGESCLKIGRYAGVLQTPDGTQLEILPKTTAAGEDNEQARLKLIKMLCFLGPFRALETSLQAAVRLKRMPLWEIFIPLFLESVNQLVRRGLRFAYVRHRANQTYCRGKLLMAEQIRHNFTHPERFFVEYDRFSPDRPANRLIRAALNKTRFLTTEPNNQHLLRELTFALADIHPSSDYRMDFQRVRLDREMGYYPPVLDWSRLILEGYNPVTASGKQTTPSLLFPMPEVFEKYVAGCLQRILPPTCRLIPQVQSKHLTRHKGKNYFTLKPDILIEKLEEKTATYHPISIMDTKWKLLNQNRKHYGIEQSDLYQMFAYGHKYLDGEGHMALIYPKTPEFSEPLEPFYFSDHPRLQLHILPFDLEKEKLILPASGFPCLTNLPKTAQAA